LKDLYKLQFGDSPIHDPESDRPKLNRCDIDTRRFKIEMELNSVIEQLKMLCNQD